MQCPGFVSIGFSLRLPLYSLLSAAAGGALADPRSRTMTAPPAATTLPVPAAPAPTKRRCRRPQRPRRIRTSRRQPRHLPASAPAAAANRLAHACSRPHRPPAAAASQPARRLPRPQCASGTRLRRHPPRCARCRPPMRRSPTNCTISPTANSTASSATRKTAPQIDAFYSGRNYAPLWITDGKANARANAAIAYLGHVDADGLDPADYPVPNFAAATTPAELADAEIKLTMSVITYAHHASIGRVHWSRVSADIEYTTTAPEPADVLAAIAGAQRHCLPRSTPTSRIRRAISRSRPSSPTSAPARSTKRHGADRQAARCSRSACRTTACRRLRERLGVLGDGGTTYDKAVAEAVKKFQQEHQIAATGTLTAATVEALNGKTPDHGADIILANMERWRWMPHQLPGDLCHRQSAGFHAARDARRQAGLDDQDRDRQAGHADAAHDGGHEIHHHQSDLERAALDRQPRISAGAGAGSDGARPHGTEGQPQSRRHGPHLAAAGRQERARPHPLQFPQQVPGLSARHAGQIPVRLRQAGAQPRLHAGAGSAALRRSAAVAGPPERRLHRRPHQEDDRRKAAKPISSSRPSSRST